MDAYSIHLGAVGADMESIFVLDPPRQVSAAEREATRRHVMRFAWRALGLADAGSDQARPRDKVTPGRTACTSQAPSYAGQIASQQAITLLGGKLNHQPVVPRRSVPELPRPDHSSRRRSASSSIGTPCR